MSNRYTGSTDEYRNTGLKFGGYTAGGLIGASALAKATNKPIESIYKKRRSNISRQHGSGLISGKDYSAKIGKMQKGFKRAKSIRNLAGIAAGLYGTKKLVDKYKHMKLMREYKRQGY